MMLWLAAAGALLLLPLSKQALLVVVAVTGGRSNCDGAKNVWYCFLGEKPASRRYSSGTGAAAAWRAVRKSYCKCGDSARVAGGVVCGK